MEWARVIAAWISALAAVCIPIVVYNAAQEARNNDIQIARQSRTLEFVRTLDSEITLLVAEKILLDSKNQNNPGFDYDYISNNKDIQKLTFGILNKYEAMCTGLKYKLLDQNIILDLRADALKATFVITLDIFRNTEIHRPFALKRGANAIPTFNVHSRRSGPSRP